MTYTNCNFSFTQTLSPFGWKKDINSRFVEIGSEKAALIGFKKPEYAIGKTDYELPSKISELASIFIKNDKKTMEQKSTKNFCEVMYNSHNELRMYLVQKSPNLFQGQLIGTIGHALDITSIYGELNSFFLKDLRIFNKLITNSYTLVKDFNDPIRLTDRQSECLFFLLRGKSSKEIASILNLSHKTVEHHLNMAKYKLNCGTKGELIDRSISLGFLNFIPISFFNYQFSIEII